MLIEVIAVGSELLNGDLQDAHTARFGSLLRRLGLGIQWAQTVPDELSVVRDALKLAASRSDLVLVTGGLGATGDDLTMEAASLLTGEPLTEDGPTLARIKARYAAMDRPFLPALAKQALIPRGARALDNDVGSAPGVALTFNERTFFFFPGVPSELEHLVDEHLRPWLAEHANLRPRHSQTFKTFGKSESGIAQRLEDMPRDPRVTVAYRASFPQTQVTLHVQEADADAAQALLVTQSEALRERLGALVYSEDHALDFAEAVSHALTQHPSSPTLALAESCTGGLVSTMITDVPGVSRWFLQGCVTSSNEAKS